MRVLYKIAISGYEQRVIEVQCHSCHKGRLLGLDLHGSRLSNERKRQRELTEQRTPFPEASVQTKTAGRRRRVHVAEGQREILQCEDGERMQELRRAAQGSQG